jgi:enoyl-[acyl-carrier-protein] reductase (NADH)
VGTVTQMSISAGLRPAAVAAAPIRSTESAAVSGSKKMPSQPSAMRPVRSRFFGPIAAR